MPSPGWPWPTFIAQGKKTKQKRMDLWKQKMRRGVLVKALLHPCEERHGHWWVGMWTVYHPDCPGIQRTGQKSKGIKLHWVDSKEVILGFIVPSIMPRTEHMRKKWKPSRSTNFMICGHKDFFMEDHSVERNSPYTRRWHNVIMIWSGKEEMIVFE